MIRYLISLFLSFVLASNGATTSDQRVNIQDLPSTTSTNAVVHVVINPSTSPASRKMWLADLLAQASGSGGGSTVLTNAKYFDSVSELVAGGVTNQVAIVGGYWTAGDGGGGVFVPVHSTSSTNLGTRIASATSGWSHDRIYNGAPTLAMFGAKSDGTTDATMAFTNAIASSLHVIIPQGTYRIASAQSVARTNTLEFQTGGMLSIDSGIVLSLTNAIFAPPQQIFTGSGDVFFPTQFRGPHVHVNWFGADSQNVSDSQPSIQKAFNSLASSGFAQPVEFGGGVYRLDTGISVTNSRVFVRGMSSDKTYLNFRPSADGSLFTFPNGGDSFTFEGLRIRNVTTSGPVRTSGVTMTNSTLSEVTFHDVHFERFNKYAVDITAIQEFIANECKFYNIENKSAWAGSGSGAAIALNFGTNYATALRIDKSSINSCDKAIYAAYGSGFSLKDSSVQLIGVSGVEIGNAIDVGATLYQAFSVVNCYFEGNRGTSIALANVRGATVQGSAFAGTYGGTTYTTNHIDVTGTSRGLLVTGSMFEDVATSGKFVKVASGSENVRLLNNSFVQSSSALQTWAALTPYVSSTKVDPDWLLVNYTGTPTASVLPKITTSPNTIGDSQIYDNGTYVGIGTNSQTQAGLYLNTTIGPALRVRRSGGSGSFSMDVNNIFGAARRDVVYTPIPDSTSSFGGHAFYTHKSDNTDNFVFGANGEGNFTVGFSSITSGAKFSVDGGAHIGGTSDPGDNNLEVDGTIVAQGNIRAGALSASKLLRVDSSTNLAAVTIGSGLSFDGTTLSASGGGSQTPWSSDINGGGYSLTNSGTIITTNISVSGLQTNSLLNSSGFAYLDSAKRLTNTPTPPFGAIPISDGSSVFNLSMTNGIRAYDDFIAVATGLGWTTAISGGTGGTAGQNAPSTVSPELHPGQIRLRCGSGASAAYSVMNRSGTASFSTIQLGGGAWTQEWLVIIPTLPDASNDATIQIGFQQSSTTTNSANGVFFRLNYSGGSTAGKWRGYCRKASSESADSAAANVTAAGGTWYYLKIVVNSGATQVDYYVNDTLIGSVTTNIPNTSSNQVTPTAIVYANGSLAAVFDMYVDDYAHSWFSSSRRF